MFVKGKTGGETYNKFFKRYEKKERERRRKAKKEERKNIKESMVGNRKQIRLSKFYERIKKGSRPNIKSRIYILAITPPPPLGGGNI